MDVLKTNLFKRLAADSKTKEVEGFKALVLKEAENLADQKFDAEQKVASLEREKVKKGRDLERIQAEIAGVAKVSDSFDDYQKKLGSLTKDEAYYKACIEELEEDIQVVNTHLELLEKFRAANFSEE